MLSFADLLRSHRLPRDSLRYQVLPRLLRLRQRPLHLHYCKVLLVHPVPTHYPILLQVTLSRSACLYQRRPLMNGQSIRSVHLDPTPHTLAPIVLSRLPMTTTIPTRARLVIRVIMASGTQTMLSRVRFLAGRL